LSFPLGTPFRVTVFEEIFSFIGIAAGTRVLLLRVYFFILRFILWW
jgi:hypothetical protein